MNVLKTWHVVKIIGSFYKLITVFLIIIIIIVIIIKIQSLLNVRNTSAHFIPYPFKCLIATSSDIAIINSNSIHDSEIVNENSSSLSLTYYFPDFLICKVTSNSPHILSSSSSSFNNNGGNNIII